MTSALVDAVLAAEGIEISEFTEESPAEGTEHGKRHGDPTLGGDGLLIAIDADCPHCGWPERTFDTRTRGFGCIKCTYISDERNA